MPPESPQRPSEYRNPFSLESKPTLSNKKALNCLSPGENLGNVMEAVLEETSDLSLGEIEPIDLPDPKDPEPSPIELPPREKELEVRMQEAEAIFNREASEGKTERHFFGPKQIKEAFGFEPSLFEIPQIPYSKEILEEAERQGYELILRVEKDDKGCPMNARRIYDLLFAKHGNGEPNSWGETRDKAKIFHEEPDAKQESNQAWFAQEDFFLKDSLKAEWKLEARAVLPDSESKNYIEQTRLLRDTLKVQGALTKDEEAECTDQRLQELTILMSTNWQEASRQLASLQITQHHRRSFAEALYGQFLRQATSGQDFKNSFIDQHIYDWTSSRSSGGYLVRFGGVLRDGACVYRNLPGAVFDGIHLLPVR